MVKRDRMAARFERQLRKRSVNPKVNQQKIEEETVNPCSEVGFYPTELSKEEMSRLLGKSQNWVIANELVKIKPFDNEKDLLIATQSETISALVKQRDNQINIIETFRIQKKELGQEIDYLSDKCSCLQTENLDLKDRLESMERKVSELEIMAVENAGSW